MSWCRGLLLVIALAAASACGSAESGDDLLAESDRVAVIDVTAGTYRGIPLGGTPEQMFAVLGRIDRADQDETASPTSVDEDYGPFGIAYPDVSCPAPFYRYEHVALGFNCDELLWVKTVKRGEGTREGVGVGDPLAAVAPAYPGAVCGNAGGGEWEEYSACSLEVAPRRFVWFGGDPIVSITIGSVPLEGVSADEPFTGEVFTLTAGDFVTYPPGKAKPGDKIVCEIDGKRIETIVPPPNTGVSTDPMYVATKPDGSVRAECGGIHAETAPPGSW